MRQAFFSLPRAVLAALAGATLCGASPAQAQQAASPTPLFGGAEITSMSLSRATRMQLGKLQRVRLVRAYSSKLASSKQLQLDMFANWKGVATRTRFERRKDGFLWAGKVNGDRLSSVLFVVRKGRLTGHLNTTGGDFTVQTVSGDPGTSGGPSLRDTGDNIVALGQPEPRHGEWCGMLKPPAKYLTGPAWNASIAGSPNAARSAGVAKIFGASGVGSGSKAVRSGPIVRAASVDDTTIDVMFAYSNQAADENPNIESDLQFTIDDANQTFINSGLGTRLRLVHTEHVDYDDSGSLGTDLNAVTSKNDGKMDNVHPLRDQYGADLVCFVPAHSSDGYAGLAWVMGEGSVGPQFEGLGFSAVDGDALTYAFSHEIGHNMGSSHDHVTNPGDHPAYPYSFGYINTDKKFYTIMSYTTACDNAKVGCRRLQSFSNPDLTDPESGVPIGVPEGQDGAADNRKTFTNTTPIVAAFRSSRPSILVDNARITEGDSGSRNLSLTVSRSAPTAKALTISYSFADISAKNGEDYTGKPGTITFAAGEQSKTLVVPIIPDTRYEGDETFAIDFTGDPNEVLADARSVVTIIDDDNPNLSITGGQIVEGDGSTLPQMAFKITADGPQARIGSIRYVTRDITTQSGIDYYPTSGTLTFTANQTEATILVPIRGDNIAEPDEKFELVLSNPSNLNLPPATASATIINDDVPSINLSDATVRESAEVSAATFTVTTSLAWPTPITVGYTTADATANGSDYVAQSGTVTFAPGQTKQTITVPIVDDLTVEADEVFAVRLRDAVGGRIEDGDAMGTIQDNDSPGLFVADAQEVEGDGLGSATRYLRFNLSLDTPATNTSAVFYTTRDGSATGGTDYDVTSGTLTLVAGQTTAQVLVPIRGDLSVEGNENLQLVLSSPSGVRIARDTATGTIQDDDVPSISISDATAREATGGSVANFTVSLSNAWPTAIAVNFRTLAGNGEGAAGASDFTARSGTLTFAPGQTTQTIAIPILDDAAFEADETFTVRLSDAQNGRIEKADGVGTIASNDAQPTFSIAAAKKAEGNSGISYLEFPVTLSAASSQRITVAYSTVAGTATVNSDFRAVTGELAFAAGATTATIRVPVIGDSVIEADETFSVVLGKATNSKVASAVAGRALGTILNDDRDSTPPTVSILAPRALAVSASIPAISGLAADATGVTRVSVRLQRLSDGRYWNGAAWVAATDVRTFFNATLSGNAKSVRWSRAIAVPTAQTLSGSYRIFATAYDAQGNKRDANVAVRIDKSGPSLAIANPRDKSTLRALAAVTGTASDAPAGVSKVELSILRKSDGKYWSGREWVARATSIAATLSGSSWRVASMPTSWTAGSYVFTAKATDKLGNITSAVSNVTFASSPAV